MIKYSLKDFGYDKKTYRAYLKSEKSKCVKDLTKIVRANWGAYLRELEAHEEARYLTLKSKKLELRK